MRTVGELTLDHERLLTELQALLRMVGTLGSRDMRAALVRFGHALQLHLQAEEQSFAALSVREPQRLARAIAREHEELRTLVLQIHEDLTGGEVLAAMGGLGELELALRLHAVSEEQLVFPLLEAA